MTDRSRGGGSGVRRWARLRLEKPAVRRYGQLVNGTVLASLHGLRSDSRIRREAT